MTEGSDINQQGQSQSINGLIFEIDIQERLVQFAARMIKFCDAMPTSIAGNQIIAELIKTGLSPASHYSVAVNTTNASHAIQRLQLAIVDLHQCEVWLRIALSGDLLPGTKIEPLLDECQQLLRNIRKIIRNSREASG
jgi:four helix bundle protein